MNSNTKYGWIKQNRKNWILFKNMSNKCDNLKKISLRLNYKNRMIQLERLIKIKVWLRSYKLKIISFWVKWKI